MAAAAQKGEPALKAKAVVINIESPAPATSTGLLFKAGNWFVDVMPASFFV